MLQVRPLLILYSVEHPNHLFIAYLCCASNVFCAQILGTLSALTPLQQHNTGKVTMRQTQDLDDQCLEKLKVCKSNKKLEP